MERVSVPSSADLEGRLTRWDVARVLKRIGRSRCSEPRSTSGVVRCGVVWCGVGGGGGGGVGWGGGGGGGGGVSSVSTADVEVLRALVSRDASQIEARVGSGVYYCS